MQKKETHSHHGCYLGNLPNTAEFSVLQSRALDYQYLSRILLHYTHCSYKLHAHKYFYMHNVLKDLKIKFLH